MEKPMGFLPEKELAEATDQDWYFLGAGEQIAGVGDEVACLDWALYAWPNPVNGVYPRTMNTLNHASLGISEDCKPYLPDGTVQRGREDWMNCTSNAICNALEVKFNYGLQNDLFSEDLVKWFIEVGFINPDNGKFEIADAFSSILSGTTRQGNSLKAPAEIIRKYGIVPKSKMPDNASMTWEQYHDDKRVTQELLDLGAETLKRLNPENPERAITYEKVAYSNFGTFLKGLKWENFDSYVDHVDGDFIKRLAPNYNFLNYAYNFKINHKKKELPKEEEGENMKLYKAKDKPEVYILGKQDNLFHHVQDEPTFRNLFGDFSQVTIEEMAQIPTEQIGDPIAQVSSIAKLLNDFLYKLKGRN